MHRMAGQPKATPLVHDRVPEASAGSEPGVSGAPDAGPGRRDRFGGVARVVGVVGLLVAVACSSPPAAPPPAAPKAASPSPAPAAASPTLAPLRPAAGGGFAQPRAQATPGGAVGGGPPAQVPIPQVGAQPTRVPPAGPSVTGPQPPAPFTLPAPVGTLSRIPTAIPSGGGGGAAAGGAAGGAGAGQAAGGGGAGGGGSGGIPAIAVVTPTPAFRSAPVPNPPIQFPSR